MSYAQSLFNEITPQWFMTMLNYLKEDNRCYYVTTTLVSIGVMYFVKKIISSNKSRREKTINSDTGTANVSLETSKTNSLNEASSKIKCEADCTKLSSKGTSNNGKIPDSLISLPEQEAVSLNISASVCLSSGTTISTSEIFPLTAPTSDFESLLLEPPTSMCKILPSNLSEPQILPAESLKPQLKDLPSESSNPEFKNMPPESSMLKHQILPSVSPTFEYEFLLSESSVTELEIPPSVSSVPEFENVSSESSKPEFEILPSESFRNELGILPSVSPTTELGNLPSMSPVPEGNLPSMSPVPELENLPSGSPVSEHEMLVSESPTSGNKTEISDDNVLVEQQKEFTLQVPIIQSQTNEKFISHLPSFSDDSSRTLLPKANNESVSLATDAVLAPLLQDSKEEVSTKPLVEEENTILSIGLTEKSNDISSTNSNIDEFSLDTIPLEMIYKILPMSMR